MNRDNVAWTFVILGAIASYFATMPPISDWTWAQWWQVIAAVTAIIAGKLSTSPLPGASSDSRITESELAKIQKGPQS
jgi:hypothetical protein